MDETLTTQLQHGFERWSEKAGDKSAVIYVDERRKCTVTYGELEQLSHELKNKLERHTSGGSTVACLCKSSPYIPALMLGILKATCAFAFLDIQDARSHFANIRKHVVVTLLIADEKLFQAAWDHSQWEVVESFWSNMYILARKDHPTMIAPANFNTGMDIAYVMQTSGSTGKPKIVRVPHRCIVPNVDHLSELFGISRDDVVFQAAPLTFDPCVVEIFLALTAGATLLMTSNVARAIPSLVSSILVENGVTVMQVTPSFFLKIGKTRARSTLLSRESKLRILAFGGETCLTSGLLADWREEGNTTNFFNVYGITEVSCWATCHRINVTKPSSERVPLGDPLRGTVLEVRDESGKIVEQGVGSLLVGGTERRCLIDSESIEDLERCHMRDTGDIVRKFRDGSLTHIGRRDAVFKYNGKKTDPSHLEEEIKRIPSVQGCHCRFVESRALLFVFVLLPPEEDRESSLRLIDNVLKEECRCPRRVIPVGNFPLTSHGKVNTKALVELADRKQQQSSELVSITECKVLLARRWKELMGRGADNKIDPDGNFILSGGNSLAAVTLADELELATGRALPLLVETIINAAFSDVEAYVDGSLGRVQQKEGPELRKRKRDPAFESSCTSVVGTSSCFHCVSRFDVWNRCPCGGVCNLAQETTVERVSHPRLCFGWKFDLSKCVDASPLLVHYVGGDTVVFIGSHYGKFCAIDNETGASFWEARVPDRIESSACVSACGEYVAFGCYDHHIYCLAAQSGTLHWRFRTEGEVKSSPTLNRTDGNLLCGSHDGHVYCIEFTTGRLKWKHRISKGSVFATPAVSYDPHCVYGATLDGKVAALHPESGDTSWSVSVSKPVFASPLVLDRGVCVCCVGGTASLLDHVNGSVLWTTKVGGPIFSSPTQLREPVPSVLFGCHDGHVYAVKEEDGSKTLSLSVDSLAYSTVFYTEQVGETGAIVAASSSGTLYVVDPRRGAVLTSHRLPGEVFSSPVVYGKNVVVGCRDNSVYSLSLL